MKKDGFNPRVNKLKNVNKMTPSELDETNKILENELKKRKLNINNLSKYRGNLSPTSKAKTSASNSICRESTDNNNSNQNKNINKKINDELSSISLKKENFRIEITNQNSNKNYNDNILSGIDKTEREKSAKKEYFSAFMEFRNEKSSLKNREHSENACNTHHNKSQTNEIFESKSYKDKLNKSAIYIKTVNKVKNLIPFKPNPHADNDDEKQMKQCLDRLKLCQKIHLPKEKNYFISEKNLKLLEQAITEKECDINILRGLLNMAKDDIDLYKNRYETVNLYIDDILKDKNNLLDEIEKISEEKKGLKENFDEYLEKYKKILIFFKKIEKIVLSMMKMRDLYNDFVETFADKETNLNLQKKFYLECGRIEENNEIASYIKIPEKAQFLIKFQEILKDLESNEINLYLKFFNRKKYKKKARYLKNPDDFCDDDEIGINSGEICTEITKQEMFLNPIDSDLKKYQQEIKELKEKIYDYETYFKKSSLIYESKNLSLADAAKDVIQMKKRIASLNEINQDLERENEYLRISYHSIYNDLYGGTDDNAIYSSKIKKDLDQLKEEEGKLRSIIEDWKTNYLKSTQEKDDILKKYDLMNIEIKMKNDEILRIKDQIEFLINKNENLSAELSQRSQSLENLSQEIKKKDKIFNDFSLINKENLDKNQVINELKNKIIDMEKNTINKNYLDSISQQNLRPQKIELDSNHNLKDMSNLTDYINENNENDEFNNNDLNKTYNPQKNLMKEIYFENHIKNKKNNRDLAICNGKNSPKNSDENIIYNSNLITNLRRKLQKQEIDLKFLNEKLKRVEKESLGNINYRNEDKNSKLNEREADNITDLLFHLYNQAKLIEQFTTE